MSPQDFVSIIGALADAIASGLIALYYGFLAFPTGIAFALAAFLALIWGLVTPISFQAETIVLAGPGTDFDCPALRRGHDPAGNYGVAGSNR